MENHYNCIYLYVNKINDHKYVGQAKDFKRRYYDHLKPCKNKLPIDRAINKYGIRNFEIIILKENLRTQQLLDLWERYFIKKYDCLSRENYNISSGGWRGNPLAGKTEEEIKEIRNKQSKSLKGLNAGEKHWNYGDNMSQETKEKIRKTVTGKGNPFYGKHHTEEVRKKLSEQKQGENNPKSKAVICITTGEIFNYIGDAVKKYTPKNLSGISKCCKGKQNTCGVHPVTGEKLKWMYLDQYNNQYNN